MDTDVFAVGASVMALTVIKKLMDLVRFGAAALRHEAGAAGSFVSQAVVYAIAIFVVWLVAGSSFGNGWVLGPVVMTKASFSDIVLIGLGFGSAASVGWDYLKARDASQSAAVPPLVKE